MKRKPTEGKPENQCMQKKTTENIHYFEQKKLQINN